jgi:phosphatidylethanolamine/phosphatidyl-N-methylethanolamine N-methyltransferase
MRASDVELASDRLLEAAHQDCARTYDRIAPLYDLLDAAYERLWKGRLRAELFAHARGRVLDVGIGTGANIPHYPEACAVVGIDSSRGMLERAGDRARSRCRPLDLFQMNLLDLAFADHMFDTVAATFVLICVPKELQLEALRELRRVCRPDGQILILDYRLSSRPVTRALMRAMSPWLRFAFAGRYDAGTEDHIENAGLRVALRRSFIQDAVRLLILKPSG